MSYSPYRPRTTALPVPSLRMPVTETSPSAATGFLKSITGQGQLAKQANLPLQNFPQLSRRTVRAWRRATERPSAPVAPVAPVAQLVSPTEAEQPNPCSRITILSLLGRGAYGQVYEGCLDPSCPLIYAAKVVPLDTADERVAFERESQFARRADELGVGPRVAASLVCRRQGKTKGHLFLEKWTGSLDQMQPPWCLDREQIRSQLEALLAALHQGGVVHGDVAPRNVLFRLGDDGAPQLVLSDFGFSFAPDNAPAQQQTIDTWIRHLVKREGWRRRDAAQLRADWTADPTRLDAWLLDRMMAKCAIV